MLFFILETISVGWNSSLLEEDCDRVTSEEPMESWLKTWH